MVTTGIFDTGIHAVKQVTPIVRMSSSTVA